MPITYPTVDIGQKEYPVLAGLSDAIDYLAAEPSADAWRAGTGHDQVRWLVGATRALLRQSYVPGTLDGPAVPPALAEASMLLAAALAAGFDPANPQGQHIKRQKAGSVEQDFYYTETTPLRFPLAVMQLLLPLFGDTSTAIGTIVHGACGRSSFEDSYGTIYGGGWASDDDNRWRRIND